MGNPDTLPDQLLTFSPASSGSFEPSETRPYAGDSTVVLFFCDRLQLEFRLRCQEATSWEEVITVKNWDKFACINREQGSLYKIDVK